MGLGLEAASVRRPPLGAHATQADAPAGGGSTNVSAVALGRGDGTGVEVDAEQCKRQMDDWELGMVWGMIKPPLPVAAK